MMNNGEYNLSQMKYKFFFLALNMRLLHLLFFSFLFFHFGNFAWIFFFCHGFLERFYMQFH